MWIKEDLPRVNRELEVNAGVNGSLSKQEYRHSSLLC